MKITEAYAAHVARDAFFWAWPLVNIYNRRLAFSKMKEPAMSARCSRRRSTGSPCSRTTSIRRSATSHARTRTWSTASASLALDVSPVVIQVPDFGDRFWVYQIVDLRTDSFVQLGKMYGTTPGFYLLVGPDWNGEVPKGVTRVFRASTKTGLVAPRIVQDDTPEDKRAIQAVLTGIAMYPLAEYDGRMKSDGVEQAAQGSRLSAWRRGNKVGLARKVLRRASGRARRCTAAARRGSALRPGARRHGGRQGQSEAEAGDDRGRQGCR